MNLEMSKHTTSDDRLSIDETRVFEVIVHEVAARDPFRLDLPTIRTATGLSDSTILQALNRLDEAGKIILKLSLDPELAGGVDS